MIGHLSYGYMLRQGVFFMLQIIIYYMININYIQLIIEKTRSYVIMYCLNTFYVFMFIGSGLSHKQYF